MQPLSFRVSRIESTSTTTITPARVGSTQLSSSVHLHHQHHLFIITHSLSTARLLAPSRTRDASHSTAPPSAPGTPSLVPGRGRAAHLLHVFCTSSTHLLASSSTLLRPRRGIA
ncbi:hypothetical protein BST61_g8143 [Cercospora zeina]